jgi:peptidoglycan/xylan/chitin deacetylase (PgdA/CDA1 family)
MLHENKARPGVAKTIAWGLVSWGLLLCLAAGILVTRLHAAQAIRAEATRAHAIRALAIRRPLPPLRGHLAASQVRRWRSFPAYRGAVPVLNYHSIGGHPSYLTVSRPLFARQMRALVIGGFHTLTIRQYAAYVRGRTDHLPSRPILLTFDDGRLDAYRGANAILRSYGLHATDLVVPGWVTAHPGFSQSWAEIRQMNRSGTWDIEPHFGYGREDVRFDKAGEKGSTFGYREYIPGTAGHTGHNETFAHFQQRFTDNMRWSVRKLREELPGYHPIAMAIPESNYGQATTNDQRIAPYVLPWLDRHFRVVFGGDYFNLGKHRPFQIADRFSRKLSYRITMGPTETLPVFRCRLLHNVRHRPIWSERQCLRRARHPRPRAPLPMGSRRWIRSSHANGIAEMRRCGSGRRSAGRVVAAQGPADELASRPGQQPDAGRPGRNAPPPFPISVSC